MNFGFGHESSSRRSLDTLVCALWGYSFENEIRVKAGRTHFDESFTTLSAQLNRVVLSECWDLCRALPDRIHYHFFQLDSENKPDRCSVLSTLAGQLTCPRL